MEPHRDLDSFGWDVMNGDIDSLKERYSRSVDERLARGEREDAARASAAQDIYSMKWGPTRVPIYNIILLCGLTELGAQISWTENVSRDKRRVDRILRS